MASKAQSSSKTGARRRMLIRRNILAQIDTDAWIKASWYIQRVSRSVFLGKSSFLVVSHLLLPGLGL